MEEEAERKRQEAEMKRQQEAEEEEEQEAPQPVHQKFDKDDGEAGAFVQEARKLIGDDEPEQQQEEQEDKGPKIKMGGIGRKRGKKQQDQQQAHTKNVDGTANIPGMNRVQASKIGADGFTE